MHIYIELESNIIKQYFVATCSRPTVVVALDDHIYLCFVTGITCITRASSSQH
jgi:hypothetical protein